MLSGHRELFLVGAVIAIVWAFVSLQVMLRRGGNWSQLIVWAILSIAGLETAVTQLVSPRARVDDPTATTSPLAGTVSHYLALTCLSLSVVGCVYGVARQRIGNPQVLIAVWLLAAGPLIASVAGTAPHWTKGLLFLPLTATAIAYNADLDLPWLVTQLRRITRVYTYGSLVAFVVANHWATYPPPPNSAPRAWFGISQVAGLTPHPNSLGPIAAIAVMLEFAVVARSRRWQWHAAAGLLTMVLAESRSGFMMLAVGLLLLHARPSGGPLYRGWLGRLSYLGVLTTLGAALFTSSSPSGLVAQITTTNATNLLNGRTSVWQYAWAEFQRNQLFGYGPGLFGTAYRSLLPAQLQFAGEAHNQFMQTLGEAGLVGLAGLVGYLVLSSRAALRCRQSTRGLSLALMLSLVVRMAAEAPLQNYGVNIALFSHLAVLAVLLYGREAEAAPAEKSSSPRHQPQRVLVAA